MSVKRWNILIWALGLCAFAALWSYAHYQQTHFVKTQNAYVTTTLTPVQASLTGKLIRLDIHPGDRVLTGQALGEVRPAQPPQDVDLLAVRSPLSGQIVDVFAHEGEVVTPQTTLAYAADLDRMEVLAYVDEGQSAGLAAGLAVQMRIPSDGPTVYRGVVEEIGQVTAAEKFGGVASTGGTFTKMVQRVPVTIAFLAESPPQVRLGMSARVTIFLRQ